MDFPLKPSSIHHISNDLQDDIVRNPYTECSQSKEWNLADLLILAESLSSKGYLVDLLVLLPHYYYCRNKTKLKEKHGCPAAANSQASNLGSTKQLTMHESLARVLQQAKKQQPLQNTTDRCLHWLIIAFTSILPPAFISTWYTYETLIALILDSISMRIRLYSQQ